MGGAYTSISIGDFAQLVGLTEAEAVHLAEGQEGWSVDSESKMILPQRLVGKQVEPPPSAEKLRQLTDYIAYLEK